MVHRLLSVLLIKVPLIFSFPEKFPFTHENVFELQPLLHYQAHCTGKYSNIYKPGVIFNSQKSGQQDTAVPFLAGFWFKILTIASHFFLVRIWLPTRKINSHLVSLMLWENVNDVLCWKHLPGVGIREIREITKTLPQLLVVEAIMGPRDEHQPPRPSGGPSPMPTPAGKSLSSHPCPNPCSVPGSNGDRAGGSVVVTHHRSGVPSTALTLPGK